MTETEKKIAELEAGLAALKSAPPEVATAKPLRLDLGCGPNKKEGFEGVDIRQFLKEGKDAVDTIVNLGDDKWPWEDATVDEVHCSHMVEHLTWPQRVHFFNELGRVLKKGAKAQIITPHWASARFYGDPTHQAPFSEFAWFYLLKSWREVNAPHVGYTCDFDVSYGYTLHPALTGRNQEYINFAMTWYTEARQDMIATAVKR